MENKRVIGIGWDVGGWLGGNHGVAACGWNEQDGAIKWLGKPAAISIPLHGLLSIKDLLNAAGINFTISDDTVIVIGVDAPLGFPADLSKLLRGEEVVISRPEREISNTLAYRETDRVIQRIFGKKPLSASFDRIGNNATVAMVHTRKWQKENGFKIYPFDKRLHGDKKMILEVYPALVKERRDGEAFEGIRPFLPGGVPPGTDAYDAAICALYAVSFGCVGKVLPMLEGPQEGIDTGTEGWIYHLSMNDLEKLKTRNLTNL